MIRKRTLILLTLGAWLIACALYGYYYVVTILALPEPYDAYARNWQFQVLAFSIVRLPILVVVLLVIVYLEIVVIDWYNKRSVQQ